MYSNTAPIDVYDTDAKTFRAPFDFLTIPSIDLQSPELNSFVKESLARVGACIVRNVASKEELDSGEAILWQWLESLPNGLKRGKKNSVIHENWKNLGFTKHGVVCQFGIGTSDFMWYCRGLPGVRRIFSELWECPDNQLVSSLDGCGVARNPFMSPRGESWFTEGGWYHVDQNYHRNPSFELCQGLLNFKDSSQFTGSTIIVPRSHLKFGQIFETPRSREGDFIPLNETDDFSNFCHSAIQPQLNSGDFLLWDSRTVHCNQGVDRSCSRSDLGSLSNELIIRIVAYVCMIPRDNFYQRGGDLGLRALYQERGMTSTHDPVIRNACRFGADTASSSSSSRFTNNSDFDVN